MYILILNNIYFSNLNEYLDYCKFIYVKISVTVTFVRSQLLINVNLNKNRHLSNDMRNDEILLLSAVVDIDEFHGLFH